eukprot:767565-Hanusia_phi.AAC.3
MDPDQRANFWGRGGEVREGKRDKEERSGEENRRTRTGCGRQRRVVAWSRGGVDEKMTGKGYPNFMG